jgi:hypothetical protein
VRQNVKSSVRQVLADGSALVAVAVADPSSLPKKRPAEHPCSSRLFAELIQQ